MICLCFDVYVVFVSECLIWSCLYLFLFHGMARPSTTFMTIIVWTDPVRSRSANLPTLFGVDESGFPLGHHSDVGGRVFLSLAVFSITVSARSLISYSRWYDRGELTEIGARSPVDFPVLGSLLLDLTLPMVWIDHVDMDQEN